MENPLFSIIVVTLNPGEKLFRTIKSIQMQSCQKLEVIIKDGGSKDGVIEKLQKMQEQEVQKNSSKADFWKRVYIYKKPDTSIYDGMNQATKLAAGKYYYFLNCGDLFYSKDSLAEAEKQIKLQKTKKSLLCYGDIFDTLRNSRIASNPKIDGFACYRNVPCHQACIYARELFLQRGYKAKFRVRADYEHFLWCYYKKKAAIIYIPVLLASYEGGGFSETLENKKRSKQEQKEITKQYMTKEERFKYRLILALTLAPLRTWIAENPITSGFYNKAKNFLYRRRSKRNIRVNRSLENKKKYKNK